MCWPPFAVDPSYLKTASRFELEDFPVDNQRLNRFSPFADFLGILDKLDKCNCMKKLSTDISLRLRLPWSLFSLFLNRSINMRKYRFKKGKCFWYIMIRTHTHTNNYTQKRMWIYIYIFNPWKIFGNPRFHGVFCKTTIIRQLWRWNESKIENTKKYRKKTVGISFMCGESVWVYVCVCVCMYVYVTTNTLIIYIYIYIYIERERESEGDLWKLEYFDRP